MRLTQTFVGRVPSGPGPGSVLVKWVTPLAVSSLCVMLAGTNQGPVFPFHTLTGVTVTLTPKGKHRKEKENKTVKNRYHTHTNTKTTQTHLTLLIQPYM